MFFLRETHTLSSEYLNPNMRKLHTILTYCIAAVWLINGLFCKLLNFVPRHQLIVARILGEADAALFTKAIGVAETAMAVWILSGTKARFNAITQMAIMAAMNALEFFLAPDLLLWGKLNAVFALLLILVIYFNEFYLANKLKQYP